MAAKIRNSCICLTSPNTSQKIDESVLVESRRTIEKDVGEDAVASFKVMTWNVLAQPYIAADFYPYWPAECREEASRHKQILAEISEHSPDVICLQEVTEEEFRDQEGDNVTGFSEDLAAMGYLGTYEPRNDLDGQAIFWKGDKFHMLERHMVDFSRIARDAVERFRGPEGQEYAASDLGLLQDRIALIVVLQPIDQNRNAKDGSSDGSDSEGEVKVTTAEVKDLDEISEESEPLPPIVIVNVHHFHSWGHPDAAAFHCSLLMNEVHQFFSRFPTIFAGDFNMIKTSPQFRFLLEGELSKDLVSEFRSSLLPGQICTADALSVMFKHPIEDLGSAYEDVIGSEPEYTILTDQMCQTVDFFLYTRRFLVPTSVLIVPPKEQVRARHLGLPNQESPSDHMPLVATFAIRPTPPPDMSYMTNLVKSILLEEILGETKSIE